MVSVDVREVIVAEWLRGWELCSELGSFGSTGVGLSRHPGLHEIP